MNEKPYRLIECLECGRFFHFLAPHLRIAHGLALSTYKERWGIPRHFALASSEHRARCQLRMKARIQQGDVDPEKQLNMMAESRKSVERKPATELHRARASETAIRHEIWKRSPVLRIFSKEKAETARKRMTLRKETGESVKDISIDLSVSVSYLYSLDKRR